MYFLSNLLTGFDWQHFIPIALGFPAVCMILSMIGRGIFGKDSDLNHALSSAVGILFIYIITIVVLILGGELSQFEQLLSPLPFIEISENTVSVFPISSVSYTDVCAQILSMIILAFLVNLLDSILPKGKNMITWLFFRCGTVSLSMLAHLFVTGIFENIIPDVIISNASAILLWILVIMLGVGALKYLVGAALATINPIIGIVYTFFFANIVGRQLTKSVLTTLLLTALVYIAGQIGISTLTIDPVALNAYVPFLGLLAAVWYMII
jgi:hypothetical protein